MSERLETLKKARARMIEDRDAHAQVLAAPFDRDKAERARSKFTEIQTLRGRRYQLRSVRRSVQAGASFSRFARAEVALGMISKLYLFKRTFGSEMHLML
jgi:hypothetical protein